MALVLESLAVLSVLVFVVGSMLSMGLSLTVGRLRAALSDRRLVAKALVGNFLLVPLSAYAILQVVPLTEAQSVGVLLLATAAGAPFLPRLVESARGDIALGVGLMVLLMVATVVYVPLVLPLLLPGVAVSPLDIARSLVLLMLLPLAAGLFVRARYPDTAAAVQPAAAGASNTALVFLVVLALVLNAEAMLATIGTGVVLAVLLLVAAAFAVGFFLGGPGLDGRSVLGLGTAQRNVSAALLVGTANFDDPDVIVVLVVGSTLMVVVLLLVGGELGRRAERTAERPAAGGTGTDGGTTEGDRS